jgi:hypothetical protein
MFDGDRDARSERQHAMLVQLITNAILIRRHHMA